MDDSLSTFLLRFFEVTSLDYCDEFFWRTDNEYAPVKIFARANDLFEWACADAEEVTPDNIELLARTLKEAEAADAHFGPIYGVDLFSCRARGQRPQPPYYKGFVGSATMTALFNASGPPGK